MAHNKKLDKNVEELKNDAIKALKIYFQAYAFSSKDPEIRESYFNDDIISDSIIGVIEEDIDQGNFI